MNSPPTRSGLQHIGFPICTPGVDATFYTCPRIYYILYLFSSVVDPWTRHNPTLAQTEPLT